MSAMQQPTPNERDVPFGSDTVFRMRGSFRGPPGDSGPRARSTAALLSRPCRSACIAASDRCRPSGERSRLARWHWVPGGRGDCSPPMSRATWRSWPPITSRGVPVRSGRCSPSHWDAQSRARQCYAVQNIAATNRSLGSNVERHCFSADLRVSWKPSHSHDSSGLRRTRHLPAPDCAGGKKGGIVHLRSSEAFDATPALL
jgi:hypothetical protein